MKQKVEIRFEKREALRFISHHDLMRAVARAVRRAALPVRLSEGFNPRPRIVFPVALEVGVVSLDEAAEIEFTQCLSTQEVLARLSSVFHPALALKAVKNLPLRRAARIPIRIRYRLHLKEAEIQVEPLPLQELLRAETLPFSRPREKRIQKVDLKPALLDASAGDEGDLWVDVRPGPKGSVRPLEVLSLLLHTPLSKLKHVRITKVLMELSEPLTRP